MESAKNISYDPFESESMDFDDLFDFDEETFDNDEEDDEDFESQDDDEPFYRPLIDY